MKKKVLVTAAVCALSVACVFGATACNKDDGSSSGAPDVGPSVEVTEEQWNAAIERSSTLTNYTASSFARVTETIDGHTYMVTQSRATYVVGDELFDTISSIAYYKGGGSTREEMYIKKEGNVEYLAYWYGPIDGWNVQKNENVDSFSGCINFRKYNYSEFTYENGKYIGNITVTEYSKETITVTLKFNDDGYVTYIAMENEEEGLSRFQESVIYNYGTTTYNFPAAAKKAVEDYKAANN